MLLLYLIISARRVSSDWCYNQKCKGKFEYSDFYIDCDQSQFQCEIDYPSGYSECESAGGEPGIGVYCEGYYSCATNKHGEAYCDSPSDNGRAILITGICFAGAIVLFLVLCCCCACCSCTRPCREWCRACRRRAASPSQRGAVPPSPSTPVIQQRAAVPPAVVVNKINVVARPVVQPIVVNNVNVVVPPNYGATANNSSAQLGGYPAQPGGYSAQPPSYDSATAPSAPPLV